jgi:hypothetical protein
LENAGRRLAETRRLGHLVDEVASVHRIATVLANALVSNDEELAALASRLESSSEIALAELEILLRKDRRRIGLVALSVARLRMAWWRRRLDTSRTLADSSASGDGRVVRAVRSDAALRDAIYDRLGRSTPGRR